ncbi:MAG: NDP-sugar synthase [Dehalococcoidales bacterium]|nr:NDP-sugar synthase [Dehalococcoidales bacterium]
MKAVILVGGQGTRLRPLSCGTPKPMVPVLNRPLLEHVILNAAKHGVTDFVLAINYLPEAIKEGLGDGSKLGVNINYAVEETPLGTSGAVKNAEAFLDERFFVFNGDMLTGIDLGEMMRRHQDVSPKATIALTPVDNPTIYGVVEQDKNGMVKRFVEKPSWDKVTTNLINAGIYILEPDVLQHVPPATASMFETDLFPRLLEIGAPVLAFPSEAYWIDIGDPQKYLKANQDLLIQRGNEIFNEGESYIDPKAEIHPPVMIAGGCNIAAGAIIRGPSVIGPGCSIGENTIIEGSVLWEGARVCSQSHLKSCVIGYHCDIQEDCYLENCILGDYVTIGRGTREWEARIPPKSFLPPRV